LQKDDEISRIVLMIIILFFLWLAKVRNKKSGCKKISLGHAAISILSQAAYLQVLRENSRALRAQTVRPHLRQPAKV